MLNWKKLLTLIYIITSAFFMACDDEESSPKLIGKWYLYEETTTRLESGDTVYKSMYDESLEPDYFGAVLYEIQDDKIIRYYNKTDLDYNIDESAYIRNGKELTISASSGGGELFLKPVTYSFDEDMLIFKGIKDEPSGVVPIENIHKFKPYIGSIPPSSWINKIEDDEYEPDDTYQTASSIELGASQNHVILRSNNDWFKFEATAGKTYLIQISGYFLSDLNLYDTDGQTLIGEDNDSDQELEVETSFWGNSVLLWNCISNGAYYFKVTGNIYSENLEGYYSVEVNESNLTVTK